VYILCEGYRIGGQVSHRIILILGRLDELGGDDQRKLLGKRIEQMLLNGGNTLAVSAADEQVEQLGRHYFDEIRKKKRYDIQLGRAEWETVNLSPSE